MFSSYWPLTSLGSGISAHFAAGEMGTRSFAFGIRDSRLPSHTRRQPGLALCLRHRAWRYFLVSRLLTRFTPVYAAPPQAIAASFRFAFITLRLTALHCRFDDR